MAYTKLFSTIVSSSLWSASDPTRILFITLLALSDREGIVYGSMDGLGRLANIAQPKTREAFEELLGPDPNSSDAIRAPENEGRRIEIFPGGFRILNFAYYRGLRDQDDRARQNRAAQARYREKHSKQSQPASAARQPQVSQSKPGKITGRKVMESKPISEAEAEADTYSPPTPSQTVSKGNGNGDAREIPTVAEVQAVIDRHHYQLDAEAFVLDFKRSSGPHTWQAVLRAYANLRTPR